jgi:hypothetical protein
MPVEGATVTVGQFFDNFNFPATTKTHADGAYLVEHCPAGDSLLTVFKTGLAPHFRTIAVQGEAGAFNVALQSGGQLRVRVTDRSGEPIAGARVFPYKWPDTVTLTQWHNFGQTDADGVWTWDWAPEGELPYLVSKDGYLDCKYAHLRPGAELREVRLLPELNVSLAVVDDETDLPICSYRATLGLVNPKNSPPEQWQVPVLVQSAVGRHTLRQGLIPWEECVVQIEAEGYDPARSRIVRADEDSPAVVVRLRGAKQREAVVLDVDGTPAAGALVYLGTQTTPIDVLQRDLPRSSPGFVGRTGENGQFRFDIQSGDFTIFAIADSGFAWAPRKQFELPADDVPTLRLQSWARIEVTLRKAGKVLPNEPVDLGINGPWPGARRADPIIGLAAGYSRHVRTDKNGRFVFDRVPPEMVVRVGHLQTVILPVGPMLGYSPEAYFRTTAGAVRQVALGGSGRTVLGTFRMKDEAWAVDWESSFAVMDPVARPGEVDLLNRPFPMFRPQRDGTFRLEEFPPGKYKIAFNRLALKPESSLKRKEMPGIFITEVTVPELVAGDADQPVDLGELPVGFSTMPQ